MCGRHRPNERFSGKGHRDHLCKDCSRLPKEQRDRQRALIDVEDFPPREEPPLEPDPWAWYGHWEHGLPAGPPLDWPEEAFVEPAEAEELAALAELDEMDRRARQDAPEATTEPTPCPKKSTECVR